MRALTRLSGPAGGRPTAFDLFELMAVLAHDLRTPLTPVKGYAEILRTRHELGPEKTGLYAGIIVEAAARMEHSVDLLSGISTLYGGRGEIRTESVRAVDIVAERLDVWRGQATERSFEGQTDAAYGAVLADRGWLAKALDVLVLRAIRLWPAAAITVGARTNAGGESTRFSVGAIGAGSEADGRPTDRLGGAFLTAIEQVCGYEMRGDWEIDVPAAKAP